ncbi:MAG: hypothetical protein SWX82_28605 [Cyanobacteriota bacterium]|nr:hypothetical protein [Cyanobacteriota bacterium]
MKKSNSNNIRSIYFTNNLENKDFVNSQGGHHIIRKILVVGAGIFGTILSSIISLVSGVLLANIFKELTTIFKELDKYYFGKIELGLVILVPYIFFPKI